MPRQHPFDPQDLELSTASLMATGEVVLGLRQLDPATSIFTILVPGQHLCLDEAHTSVVVVGVVVVLGPV